MKLKTREILVSGLDPAKWQEIWPGFSVYPFRKARGRGLSVGLFRADKGVGSTPHRHDANQFLFCLKGEYYYPGTGVRIRPGDFYMNPRGNVHGPAVAVKDTLMLEMYDGPPAPIAAGPRTKAAKAAKTAKPRRSNAPRKPAARKKAVRK